MFPREEHQTFPNEKIFNASYKKKVTQVFFIQNRDTLFINFVNFLRTKNSKKSLHSIKLNYSADLITCLIVGQNITSVNSIEDILTNFLLGCFSPYFFFYLFVYLFIVLKDNIYVY